MSNLTLNEVESDIQDSERDTSALDSIVNGLRDFISNPCGEDRRAFRRDLFKYESLLAEAKRLHSLILAKHGELIKDAMNRAIPPAP